MRPEDVVALQYELADLDAEIVLLQEDCLEKRFAMAPKVLDEMIALRNDIRDRIAAETN